MVVSQAVIEARVREVLFERGEVLHRDEGWDEYYTTDPEHHLIERERLTLEQLACECAVMRPGELIEE
jgi:hypothetical protein